MKKVFVLQPFTKDSEIVFSMIKSAAAEVGAAAFRMDEIGPSVKVTEALYSAIDSADLVVCDLSGSNPNVMYELGYAHAKAKPVLLLSQVGSVAPFDVRDTLTLVYEHSMESLIALRKRVGHWIERALQNPSQFSEKPKTASAINKLFVSYSHQDAEFLSRLRVHLRPLEREGLIDLWDDTRIRAGQFWKAQIEDALSHSRVAILIVTADFLASDFVVENELPPLLLKAEESGTRILPLIAKACRFQRDKNLSRFQAINDPARPLIGLSEADRERVYDQLAQEVERHFSVIGNA